MQLSDARVGRRVKTLGLSPVLVSGILLTLRLHGYESVDDETVMARRGRTDGILVAPVRGAEETLWFVRHGIKESQYVAVYHLTELELDVPATNTLITWSRSTAGQSRPKPKPKDDGPIRHLDI